MHSRFLANSLGMGAGHVASFSRPSDRPSGRPKSLFSGHFAQKYSNFLEIQPTVHSPLSKIFLNKPLKFSEINLQSTRAPPATAHHGRRGRSAAQLYAASRPAPTRLRLAHFIFEYIILIRHMSVLKKEERTP